MLIQRVITALVLLPLLLAAIFLLPTPKLYAVFCLVGLAAAWEWTALMGLVALAQRLAYLAVMALALAAAWQLHVLSWGVPALCGLALVWWLYAFRLVRGFPAYFSEGPWPPARMAPLGLLLIPSTLLALSALHAQDQGAWRLISSRDLLISGLRSRPGGRPAGWLHAAGPGRTVPRARRGWRPASGSAAPLPR